jgi:ATP-dependent DNA ligase
MEALSVNAIPEGKQWQYEPKWDGFRCLVFRDGGTITLQSKFGKPLTRYFPDVAEAVRALKAKTFVLDGEIVVPEGKVFSFDALLQRIHPQAMLIGFDLLQDADYIKRSAVQTDLLADRRSGRKHTFVRVDLL